MNVLEAHNYAGNFFTLLNPYALLGGLATLALFTLHGAMFLALKTTGAQDAHIFDSTLAENLRLARPGASGADLRESLRGARLLEWADSLPGGLDTPVGEHGARLSGGQRQRLALARVRLEDGRVAPLAPRPDGRASPPR